VLDFILLIVRDFEGILFRHSFGSSKNNKHSGVGPRGWLFLAWEYSMNENSGTGLGHDRAATTSGRQEEYAYASDTLEVVEKARAIRAALDHPALTVAHLIAAITSVPSAADRFSMLRFRDEPSLLNSAHARQAALKYLLTYGGAESGEMVELFGPSALEKVISVATSSALKRAPEHRSVELGDILKVMTETELANKFRPLLLGEPMPSLGKVTETVERIDDSIRQLTENELGGMRLSMERTCQAVESHVKHFKEVVSAEDENRPSQIPKFESLITTEVVRPTGESSGLKLRDIVAAVDKNRSATDLRLATLTSSVDKLGVATAERLEILYAEAASLQNAYFKMLSQTKLFATTVASVLAVILGVCMFVVYKVYPS
jgi:hypothetical protein